MERDGSRHTAKGVISPLLANVYLHYVFDLLGGSMAMESSKRRRDSYPLRG
jgi:hypothetical protein